MFSSCDSFWNDLKGNIIIKLVSVFNIFSRGDYYINSLFLISRFLWACYIVQGVYKIYPGRAVWVIIGCFLLPSTIYFSSGIHKDGMVFLMLAVVDLQCLSILQQNRFTIKRFAVDLYQFDPAYF